MSLDRLTFAAIFVFLFSTFNFAQSTEGNYTPGELFVQFSEDMGKQLEWDKASGDAVPEFLEGLVSTYEIYSIHCPFKLKNEKLQRTYLIQFLRTEDTEELINELGRLPVVRYAERVPEYNMFYTPNDPDLTSQWHLQTVQASLAWDAVTTATSNVVIAVVDDAVLLSHEDLQPNIWTNPGEIAGDNIDNDGNGYIDDVNGWDAADNDNNPNPNNPTNSFFTHGTHCAGIASGRTDNNLGIASLGYHAKIMPVKSAQLPNPASVVAGYQGVEYAIINNADVISMSWGGGLYSATYQIIFDQAYAQGIVCVAAAGNSDTDVPQYPANYNHVISVAASDQSDNKASFSNYGTWIDVTAPGVDIYSSLAGSNSSYGTMSGTSMACPMVAGLAAMLLAIDPLMTPDQVEECIESSADDIYAQNTSYIDELGAGRINAANAVVCASQILARFESDYQFACPGQTIQFTDNSAGTPTSWNWSFPGGTPTTSTAQNPSVTYSTTGVYDVSLTVSDGTNTNTLTQNLYIEVAVPTATLTGSNTIVAGYPGYLQFEFTGNAPWSVTYSDGTNQYTVNNITTSPYYHVVNPSVTTTYSIVDFSDAGCQGTFSGTAAIDVLPSQGPFECFYTKYYGDSLVNSFSEFYYDAAEDAIYAVGKHETDQGVFARIGPQGNLTFAVAVDGLERGFEDIAPAPNGDMLCLAQDNEDIVVARFTAVGGLLWMKRYDNIRERRLSIIPSQGDSYIIAASYSTGGTSDDAAFTRIDGSGNIIWSTRFHSQDDQTYELVPDGAGGAYFSGGCHGGGSIDMYIGQIDVNGTFGTIAEYNMSNFVMNEAYDLIRLSNGDFITSSRVNPVNANPWDGKIMRLDPNFNLIWEVVYTNPSGNRMIGFDDLEEDNYGNIYATVRYDNTPQYSQVIKFDPNGNIIWAKELVDTRAIQIQHTGTNPDNLIIVRMYDGAGFGGLDGYAARTDTSLNSCTAHPVGVNILTGTSTRSNLPFSVSAMNYTVTAENPTFSPLFYQTGVICEDCNVDTTCTDMLDPNFTATEIVCLGDTIYFSDQSTANAGNIASYMWDLGDGNLMFDTTQFGYIYDTTGVFDVTLTIGNDSIPACYDSTTISVQVVDELTLHMPNDTLICVGDSVQLSPVEFICGIPFQWEFSWTPGTGMNDSTVMTPTVSPATTTVYSLMATNGTDTLTGSVTVFVDQNCCASVAAFEPLQTWCEGDSIVLTNTSAYSTNPTFEWGFGPDAIPTSFVGMNPPVIIYPVDGTYEVTLILSDDCGVDTLVQELVVQGDPVVNVGGNITLCEPGMVPLGDTAISWYSYLWSPGSLLNDSTRANPIATVTQDTTFIVHVIDNWTGCEYTDSVTVTFDCGCILLRIPNVFTPNNDGLNDSFYPIVEGDCEEAINMIIVNRWGNLIWDSEKMGTYIWNGYTMEGKEVAEGTYFYVIKFEDEVYHGVVTKAK